VIGSLALLCSLLASASARPVKGFLSGYQPVRPRGMRSTEFSSLYASESDDAPYLPGRREAVKQAMRSFALALGAAAVAPSLASPKTAFAVDALGLTDFKFIMSVREDGRFVVTDVSTFEPQYEVPPAPGSQKGPGYNVAVDETTGGFGLVNEVGGKNETIWSSTYVGSGGKAPGPFRLVPLVEKGSARLVSVDQTGKIVAEYPLQKVGPDVKSTGKPQDPGLEAAPLSWAPQALPGSVGENGGLRIPRPHLLLDSEGLLSKVNPEPSAEYGAWEGFDLGDLLAMG